MGGVLHSMKYWAFLVAKLVVGAGLLLGLRAGIRLAFGTPREILLSHPDPFAHDLTYTFVMLGFSLLAAGLLWAILWDQRYRCRTCVRRLRMPLNTGTWNHLLMGAPRKEYICLYGHGTLKVDEYQAWGKHEADWEPHTDMWKELEELETAGRR